MVDPTLPDQVQTQAAGGPSREDRAGPVEPLQEASDPVRSEPYMSSPPKREDIDARLDRIASLLETIITHEGESAFIYILLRITHKGLQGCGRQGVRDYGGCHGIMH
jgi:hypothetical protein